MFRKLFALSLFFTFTIIPISAQKTTSPEKIYRTLIPPAFGGSYLGVQTIDVSKENFSRFGLSEVQGVAIDKVLKDSPAEKAGLQSNDVIIRFDSETVTSVRKLTRLIGEVAPDHKVNLTVLRGGIEQIVVVTVGKRDFNFEAGGLFNSEIPQIMTVPEVPRTMPIPRGQISPMPRGGGDGNVFVWSSGASRRIGVTLTSLSKQLADYFGVTDGKGLLVSEVRAGSPAEKSGLKAGDVIVEVDGKKVENNSELIKTLNEKKEGSITLTIIRDRNRQTFSVTPEKSKEMNFVVPQITEDSNK